MTTLLAMYVIFGLLLAGLSIPLMLGKIPPNPWYGVRVPSTLEDERLWYKVNRYMARGLLATGLLTALGALLFYQVPGLSTDAYAWLALAAFAVPMTITVVFGIRYLRRLKG